MRKQLRQSAGSLSGMPPAYLLNYVLVGLESSPSIFAALLKDLGDNDPRWDAKPDPERFSLREAVAHLADWDEIWLERCRRICSEESPSLPSIDEGELAIQNGYANSSPRASLEKFKRGREELVAYLRQRPDTDWSRIGFREGVGEMSMFEVCAMITGHDNYHMLYGLECLR